MMNYKKLFILLMLTGLAASNLETTARYRDAAVYYEDSYDDYDDNGYEAAYAVQPADGYYYDDYGDDYYDDGRGERVFQGAVGGAASGALIGGVAGGGRGAAIGAGVGAGLGIIGGATSGRRRR